MAERQVSRDEDPEEKAREDQQKRAVREIQFQGVRKEKAAVRQYLPWVIGGLLLLAFLTIVATSGYRKENTTSANPSAPAAPASVTGAASAQGAPGSMSPPSGPQIDNMSSPSSQGNNSGVTSPGGNGAGASPGSNGAGASPGSNGAGASPGTVSAPGVSASGGG